jgi:hypothetical protein
VFRFQSGPKGWKIYGDLNSQLLIAGHSHTFALLMALRSNPDFDKTFSLVAEATNKRLGKGTIRDETYWKFVVSNSNSKQTLISWNGNQHNIHFLLEESKPFKVFQIYQEFENAPSVPISQVRELFSPTFEELRRTLNLFPNPTKVSLLGTPAPKPKFFIDTVLTNDQYFVEKASSLGLSNIQIQATTDKLRVAMWKLTQEMTKEVAQEFGCSFIPSPESTIDLNGLLREEFWSNDITHANERFGEIFLQGLTKLADI